MIGFALFRAAIRADAPHTSHEIGDSCRNLIRRGSAAQQAAQIRARHRVEAAVPNPVGRQPAAITARTERRGGRGDDAENGAVGQKETRRWRGTIAGDRGDLAIAPLQTGQHFRPRNDILHGPLGRAGHVHIFNETHFRIVGTPKLDQVTQLIIIDAPDNHCVDFGPGEILRGARRRSRRGLAHARRDA